LAKIVPDCGDSSISGGVRVILDIEGAGASWADGELHVAFDVVPEGRYHLNLKTGEIFQNHGDAAFRKQEDKVISAKLFVTRRTRSAAGADLPSEMRYVPGGRRDSEIDLVWRLPDDHLTGFHALILSGKTPKKAFVSFVRNHLEFAWEPDGSGEKWDNEKNPSVPIETVSFNFDLQVPSSDGPLTVEVPEGDDRTFFSDSARVNFALLSRLSTIQSAVERLTWPVRIIALLMVVLALSRIWR
jgi:hypothetical protein